MTPDDRRHGGQAPAEAGPPALPDLHCPKAVWREWARQRRTLAPPPDAAAICAGLLAFLERRGVTGVLAYHALPGEPDLSALAVSAPAAGLRLYTTRAVFRPEPHLTLHDWHAACEVSRFGARQPPRGTPQVSREQIGAVLLPGLAFDARGWRLGYGGGFYDRLLEGWDVLTVGVVGRALWVPELPHEAHDLPAQYVATEEGVQAIQKG